MKMGLGLGFVAFGVLLVAHAMQRRRGWWRVSGKQMLWWLYFISGGQGTLENLSERDLERQGTNTEMAAGILSIAIGIAAIVAYA